MTNSLHRKIAQIQGELKTVPRNGLNGFHKYKYATEQDVLDTIRPLCAKASISLVTDCTSFEIAKGAATVLVRLT